MYGLSGSNLAIGVSLVLRDRFTGGARAAQQQMRSMSAEMIAIQRQQMQAQMQINAVGAGIGLMAIRGMAQWTKVGAEFGYTMNYVNTIAEKKGGVGFDMLSKKAKTLGADTMFTAREVADAMKYMAMAGQDTEALYNNIGAAVALAGATMSELGGKGGTADIMTNVMKGFDINATQQNSMRVADILTMATTSANTNLSDLAEAMKYAVSTAKDLNISLEETASMVMMAGDAGIQGSMAGTAVENMLRYVTRAADESRRGRAGDALNALGLGANDLKDSKGNLLAISPLMKTISDSIVAMGTGNVDTQNLLADIFGVRGKREASILLRNMADLDGYIEKLNSGATGKATTNLESMMDTLMGSGIQLSSTWESFKIAFTEALEPVIKPLLGMLTGLLKIITAMTETPVGKWLTVIGAGFIVLKTVTMGYKAIVLSLRLLHMDMGTTAATASGRAVAGYNAMTAAATRYAGVAGGAGAMGWRSKGGGYGGAIAVNSQGRYINKKTGKFVSGAVGDRYSRMHSNRQSVGNKGQGLGRFGAAMGKGSMGAMFGGMALSMGGDAVGGGAGAAMGIAGDALSFAGTGAMVGSAFGPVGTAVGAIVGGVGSLAYSLYTSLSETADAVKDAENEAKTLSNKPELSREAWAERAKTILRMGEGDTIQGMGRDPNQLQAIARNGANALSNANVSNITIIIDGKKAMDKKIEESYYKTLIDLGTF